MVTQKVLDAEAFQISNFEIRYAQSLFILGKETGTKRSEIICLRLQRWHVLGQEFKIKFLLFQKWSCFLWFIVSLSYYIYLPKWQENSEELRFLSLDLSHSRDLLFKYHIMWSLLIRTGSSITWGYHILERKEAKSMSSECHTFGGHMSPVFLRKMAFTQPTLPSLTYLDITSQFLVVSLHFH